MVTSSKVVTLLKSTTITSEKLPVKNHKAFLLFITIIAIILISSVVLLSPNTLGLSTNYIRFPKIDTIGHFTSFFLLTWVVHSLVKLPLKIAVVTLIFYGALTELGQLYLGFRNGEFIDFLADVAGILFFVLMKWCYIFFSSKIIKTKSKVE